MCLCVVPLWCWEEHRQECPQGPLCRCPGCALQKLNEWLFPASSAPGGRGISPNLLRVVPQVSDLKSHFYSFTQEISSCLCSTSPAPLGPLCHSSFRAFGKPEAPPRKCDDVREAHKNQRGHDLQGPGSLNIRAPNPLDKWGQTTASEWAAPGEVSPGQTQK